MLDPLPILTRPRRDGWTPAVQRRCLETLADTGSPSQAAAAAGRSMQSAYKLRAWPGATAFREGWAAAIADCITQVRDQAVDRAFNGHFEPIIKHGRKVGDRQVFDNGMLLSLMRLYDAPAYHADRALAANPVAAAEPKPLTEAELIAQCEAMLLELVRVDNSQAVGNAQGV